MVLVKNGHFSICFSWAIQARKMCLTIFQNEKTPFQPIKTRSSKRRKVEIFPKGLTHGFGQKGPMLVLKSGKKLNFCKGLDRLIISKNKQWKNFKFLNKSVDQPFWKNLGFHFFKKAFVQSRKPFFPPRISIKIYFKAYVFEKQTVEKFRIFDQNVWENSIFF